LRRTVCGLFPLLFVLPRLASTSNPLSARVGNPQSNTCHPPPNTVLTQANDPEKAEKEARKKRFIEMKNELENMSSVDTFPDHDMQRYFKMLLNSKPCLNQGPSPSLSLSLFAASIAAAHPSSDLPPAPYAYPPLAIVPHSLRISSLGDCAPLSRYPPRPVLFNA